VHIQGQNNSYRCTIFVAFAEEKILHFAQKNKLGTTIPATSGHCFAASIVVLRCVWVNWRRVIRGRHVNCFMSSVEVIIGFVSIGSKVLVSRGRSSRLFSSINWLPGYAARGCHSWSGFRA